MYLSKKWGRVETHPQGQFARRGRTYPSTKAGALRAPSTAERKLRLRLA
jgi:hypothetical protein